MLGYKVKVAMKKLFKLTTSIFLRHYSLRLLDLIQFFFTKIDYFSSKSILLHQMEVSSKSFRVSGICGLTRILLFGPGSYGSENRKVILMEEAARPIQRSQRRACLMSRHSQIVAENSSQLPSFKVFPKLYQNAVVSTRCPSFLRSNVASKCVLAIVAESFNDF